MTRGLILADDGYARTQLEYAYHRLREDAVLVDVASPGGGPIDGDGGGDWETTAISDLPPGRRYDLVVIPGGDAPDRLVEDSSVQQWLIDYLDAGGIVCTIGEGVVLLSAVGALDGRMVTGPSSERERLESTGATTMDEAVTIDGTIVTARNTDALPFGIAAGLGSVAIPQDPASVAVERPHWGGPDAA